MNDDYQNTKPLADRWRLNGRGCSRQQAKEAAVLAAVRRGVGLIRRGLVIYSIHPNGECRILSSSNTMESVWDDALTALQSSEEE